MGTTANYSWPTPVATDLVKDGWEAIKDLGDAADTTVKAVSDAQGLVHINTTSFSAVASQSINDVFSATYDNYLVITTLTCSTNLSLTVRLRASGSDYSTNDQWKSIFYNSWVTGTLTDSCSKTGTELVAFGLDTSRHQHTLNLYEPFLSQRTRVSGTWTDDTDAGIMNYRAGNTNSYTGMSWIASTGTITGTVSIYGYRKS